MRQILLLFTASPFKAVVVIGALSMLVNALNQDKPPKLSLNGTELDLASLKLKDLNAAGFNMKNNVFSGFACKIRTKTPRVPYP